ncbi:glycoside hydrolase family 43 protein [Thermophagus sp. OGC60D27]|uniref:glycoside hydrolase family 43 protein n=1 Tax=Thermophagus sp. OGC60D27 TaxID=3458415 RepID=UPI00403767BF
MKRKIISFISALWVVLFASAQVPETFENPVIPGFHPDPSICRVGENYYLVNSSFEWYPGLPIHTSTDLVNWELIGYAIDRPEMLGANFNLWAPTIRYHDGKYYIICTERPGIIFFVTADNPKGPWSEPVYFDVDKKMVSAIDPSLFWDEDGTCWLASNDRNKSGSIKHWVWIQKVDLNPVERNDRLEASFTGDRIYVTDGSGVGPDNFAEGPHIYKRGDYYYLMIAEGGTWANHAVSFLRTKSLEAPVEQWEYHPDNPVLTHRDKSSPIGATGHADMVETQNGEWWSVHLGVRKQDGKHKLGRETFLVPVEWKKYSDGSFWPVYNPQKGNMTLMEDVRPDLIWNADCQQKWPWKDDFYGDRLDLAWNFYKTPASTDWLKTEDGQLRMRLLENTATSSDNFAFIGRRQQHHHFNFETKMEFHPGAENEVAGIMAFITHKNHIRFEVFGEEDQYYSRLVTVDQGKEIVIGEYPLYVKTGEDLFLKLEARGWDFQFYAGDHCHSLKRVGEVIDARLLSSEIAKGFTGSFVGLYGSSSGKKTDQEVVFDFVKYAPY